MANTADGEELPNTRAVVMPTLPTRIDYDQRVRVLSDLGQALKNAGATINVLSRDAGNIDSQLTRRVNDLVIAANSLGATPVLKTYVNIDLMAFNSVITTVANGMRTIP